jgi:hypothetical protein
MLMRSTAGNRTLTGERTAAGSTGGRTTAATSQGGGRTGGVTRPSLANVPGREKKEAAGPRAGVGTGGWADYKKKSAERSTRYATLEVPEDTQVAVKFAEAEPFAFYFRHWPKGGRADVCIADADNDVECPLCGVGDKPKPVVMYNVIDVGKNLLVVWEMSSEPTRKVQKHYDQLAARDRSLADEDLYFIVSKAKKTNGFFEYEVQRVRAADLQEEAGIDPLSPEEIEDATKKGLFTDEIVYVRSRADLQEVADGLED